MRATQAAPDAAAGTVHGPPADAGPRRSGAAGRPRPQDLAGRLSGPDGLDLTVALAHDLRSPLTSILFLAERLGDGTSGEVNAVQQRQLRLIYAAALGLASMVSDVMEMARGDDQLEERVPSPFSVAEMFESVATVLRPIAEEKRLAMRFEYPPSCYRLGRPRALSRVLLNLASNALKYTDDGYVELAARATGPQELEFSVRDTGRGMPADALADLFQPFHRTRAADGRSGHRFSGAGLGLAMCRRLVEPMGSQLQVESHPGSGTRFYFTLALPPVCRP